MIVRPLGDRAEIVMQIDHAEISGDLARSWAAELPRRDSAILAAARHDGGWAGWETAPRRNPDTARPCNFLDVAVPDHLRFYGACIDEVTAEDRYAGMLVGMHAVGIYTGRFGTQPSLSITRAGEVQDQVDAFVADTRSRYQAIQADLGVSDEELWENYVALQVFDRLSLWLCRGDPAGEGRLELPLVTGGLVIEPTDAGGTVDPWPFSEREVAVAVPVRTVRLDGYASDAETAAEILAAPIERRHEVLRPA